MKLVERAVFAFLAFVVMTMATMIAVACAAFWFDLLATLAREVAR